MAKNVKTLNTSLRWQKEKLKSNTNSSISLLVKRTYFIFMLGLEDVTGIRTEVRKSRKRNGSLVKQMTVLTVLIVIFMQKSIRLSKYCYKGEK